MISFIIPTHNASGQTLATVSILSDLVLDYEGDVEVIVVDDGSNEAERDTLRNGASGFVLLQHADNRGRGAARNTGAAAARGDVLAFLDCDCRPQSSSFIEEHLAVLMKGFDVSVGPIAARGSGFWGRYQEEVIERRARKFAAGQTFAMTSANMMIKREWFGRVGGFDARYRGYGFEDRDLLLRLAGAGARIGLTQVAVYHDADLDLPTVVRKMAEAGRVTAPLFRQSHPAAYRQLGYTVIDAHLRKWLAPFGWLSAKVLKLIVPRLDRRIEYLPFPIAAKLVRLASALAFLSGTAAGGS